MVGGINEGKEHLRVPFASSYQNETQYTSMGTVN